MTKVSPVFPRLRTLLLAALALTLLAVPAAADARKRDRNHDGIPDRWEARHGLSTTKHGVGKADPDKDGLRNRAEFRSGTNPKRADTDRDGVNDASEDGDRDHVDNGNEARERTHPRRRDTDRDGTPDGREDADRDRLNNLGEDDAGTDPMNPDSDDDGIRDGDERAGEIVSFEGGVLTIRVFGGATLSGKVDEATFIDCDGSSDDEYVDGEDSYDGNFDDEPGGDLDRRLARDEAGSDDSVDDQDSVDDSAGDDSDWSDDSDDGDDDSEDGDWGDEDPDDAGGCGVEVLQPGAVVDQAVIEVTSDGTLFDEIDLRG